MTQGVKTKISFDKIWLNVAGPIVPTLANGEIVVAPHPSGVFLLVQNDGGEDVRQWCRVVLGHVMAAQPELAGQPMFIVSLTAAQIAALPTSRHGFDRILVLGEDGTWLGQVRMHNHPQPVLLRGDFGEEAANAELVKNLREGDEFFTHERSGDKKLICFEALTDYSRDVHPLGGVRCRGLRHHEERVLAWGNMLVYKLDINY